MKDKFNLQDAIALGACEPAVDWFHATFDTDEVEWDNLLGVCPSQYVYWLARKKLITPEVLKKTLETYQIGDHAWACYAAVCDNLITEKGWLKYMLETYQIGDHAWACYFAVYDNLITEDGWLKKMGYKEKE